MIKALLILLTTIIAATSARCDDMAYLTPHRPINIVCVGDSITWGSQTASPGGATSYPYYLADDLAASRGFFSWAYDSRVRNVGVAGLGSEDLPDIDYLLSPGQANIAVVMIGVNDFYNASRTAAATVFARVSAWRTARAASGWRVIVLTCTGNTINDATGDALALAYDNLVRASGWEYVDIAADSIIGLGGTGALISIDGVHLAAAGNARTASLVHTYLTTGFNLVAGNPIIATSYGPGRDSSLKAWYRDWWTISTVKTEVYELHNLARPRSFDMNLSEADQDHGAPHVPPQRVLNAVNGQRAVRFPGDGVDLTAYYQSSAPMSSLVSAGSLLIHAVIKVSSIVASSSTPYVNDGIVCDSLSNIGLFIKSGGTLIAYANDGSFSKHADASISTGTWVAVSMRVSSGNLYVRVGTQAAWSSPTALTGGVITDLTGALRVGNNPTLTHPFNGDMADLIIRNAYDADVDAADGAYLRARYGVS